MKNLPKNEKRFYNKHVGWFLTQQKRIGDIKQN